MKLENCRWFFWRLGFLPACGLLEYSYTPMKAVRNLLLYNVKVFNEEDGVW